MPIKPPTTFAALAKRKQQKKAVRKFYKLDRKAQKAKEVASENNRINQ